MTFAWPHLLWLLVLPAALLVWELARVRRNAGTAHPKILRAEAGLATVSISEQPADAFGLSRRRILLCAGLAFGVVALARPQWGRLDEPVFDQSRDIIIALDLSRSMLTPDVKPSRLERSKLLIQSLLDKLHGERVGMIVFSGSAFLQSPVSADYEILREFLPSLGPDYLPEGGTNYRELIDTAIDAFGTGAAADRYLIILSDGEATDEDWKSRVDELGKRGIRVIGLGVGTSKGGMIPDGSGNFMKDDTGAVVLSKLESGTLRDLAASTHGTYVDASEWVDLSKVLAATVETGKKGKFVEHNTVRLAERYQWALAQCLICLLASFWLEFPVRPKSRAVRLSTPARPPRGAAAAAALLAAVLLLAPRILADEQNNENPAAALSKIVGRMAQQPSCSALDWAGLGRETVTWGQHLKSAGEKVPERPVRDALAGVAIGKDSDPKATDWAKMKSELEALLDNPEQKNKDPQQQDKDKDKDKDKDQDKKDQDKQQQDQKQGQNSQQDKDRNSKQDGQPQGQPDKQDDKKSEGQRPQDRNRAQPKDQSAFGDMGKAPTPEPAERQHAMQKVGGAKKQEGEDPARRDPQLAIPLEKLEQVKNQDSPAELFDLLRKTEPTPPVTNTGKNW